MEQPTQEQIKEFWEWCEIKPHRLLRNLIFLGVESIDLNNLFKYAVPKLATEHEGLEITLAYGKRRGGIICGVKAIILVKDLHHKEYSRIEGDPALALFWALWQVKEVSIE